MRHELIRHPDSQGAAVRVEAEIGRSSARALTLTYLVKGEIADLVLPPVTAPLRVDGLWRSTCFEAFIRAGDVYYEFNYAPSTEWAGYRFSGYRDGMTVATEVSIPDITVRNAGTTFQLSASLDLDELTHLSPAEPWRLGLSAILVDSAGRMSWWALAHPPGKPDFHHPDCFVYELPKEAFS